MAQATPDAEAIARAHSRLWNDQAYSEIPDVISESYVETNPAAPEGEIRGPEGLEAWMREVTTAFPDVQVEILDLLAGDETVMMEIEFTMTHEGEFNGIPPTDRTVEFRAMGRAVVSDGKMQELRNYFDPQELFDQLGIANESPQG